MRKKRRRWTRNNIIATVIGFFLVVILIISLVPDLAGGNSGDPVDPNDLNNDDIFELTQAPDQRSFPAPDSEVNADRMALQSTGLFQVPFPGDDWAEFESGNDYDPGRGRADIILNSGSRVAIAQAYVMLGVNYEDTQSLSDNLLTDDYFDLEWSSRYETTEVTGRTVGDTFLTIDFNLRHEDLSYFGRQISWQRDGNLYNVRFVVPTNNPDLLANLQSLFIEKFAFYPNIIPTLSTGWLAHADDDFGIMFKAPETWQRVSGGTGRVSTYEGTDGLQVTIRQIEDEVDVEDFEAVTAWMISFREGIRVKEGQLVEQRFGSGYLYSYTYPNSDGDTISGAVALFPAHSGGTTLVELRLENVDTNLLNADENPVARQILDSVTLLAPDDFVNIEQ